MNSPRPRSRIRWIPYFLVALVYLPQLPGCLAAHSAKLGRIVDSRTGLGVENVFVLASADVTAGGIISSFPEARSRQTTEYVRAVKTDNEGRYTLPPTYLSLDFGHFFPFIGGFQQDWHLAAVRPGFAQTDDIKSGPSPVAGGSAQEVHYVATYNRPAVDWNFGFVQHLSDVQITPVDMTLAQSMDYFYSLLGVRGNIGFDDAMQSQLQMSVAFVEFYTPKICSFDSETVLGPGVDPSNFLFDRKAQSIFRETLRKTEPRNFIPRLSYAMSRPDASFSAGDLCRALRGISEVIEQKAVVSQ